MLEKKENYGTSTTLYQQIQGYVPELYSRIEKMGTNIIRCTSDYIVYKPGNFYARPGNSPELYAKCQC